MKFTQKLNIIFSLVAKRIMKVKAPLLVSWSLTNRCNYRCQYCGIWKKNSKELNTSEVFFVIDELYRCGNKAIAFTGGESLMREDIIDIIDYCSYRGIYTKLSTNGSLVKDKIDGLRKIGFVRMSFDGPKEVHDAQRQNGSYDEVVAAVDLLRKNNIKVGLNCVISKLNVGHINDILNEAKKIDLRISFQPLEYRNNREFLFENMPSNEEYKKVFEMLLAEKRRGNRYIANSPMVLNYMLNGFRQGSIKCWAGLLIWRITPEGEIMACDRLEGSTESYSCLDGEIDKALNMMGPVYCSKMCLRNYTIELNYLLSFKPSTILNLRYDF